MTIRQAQTAPGSLAVSFAVRSRAKNQHEVRCKFQQNHLMPVAELEKSAFQSFVLKLGNKV